MYWGSARACVISLRVAAGIYRITKGKGRRNIKCETDKNIFELSLSSRIYYSAVYFVAHKFGHISMSTQNLEGQFGFAVVTILSITKGGDNILIR